MDDQPRPDANSDETAYSLSVEDAALRYEAAGHPRTLRAIQKYCMRGDLECIKQETLYGQRYRITPASVARHLAQIEEITSANSHDHSRPDVTVRLAPFQAASPDGRGTAGHEHSRTVAADRPSQEQSAPVYTERIAATPETPAREQTRTAAPTAPQVSTLKEPQQSETDREPLAQTATETEFMSRYVARLEGENEFLRGQVTVKDKQIGELTERARETNVLIAGLQKMLTPLLGRPAERQLDDRSHSISFGVSEASEPGQKMSPGHSAIGQ
jgi:hypothetical protein